MAAVIRQGPMCTHRAGCTRPLHRSLLCRPQYDQWLGFGGAHPGVLQRFEVVRDGVLFDVIDHATRAPARLGDLKCWALDQDAALDALAELREEEGLEAA